MLHDALLFEELLQILFRRGDGGNSELLYEVIQHIGRNERWQRGTKADILDPQVQQRQQNAHGFLLVPGEYHRKWQIVHTAAESVSKGSGNLNSLLSAASDSW